MRVKDILKGIRKNTNICLEFSNGKNCGIIVLDTAEAILKNEEWSNLVILDITDKIGQIDIQARYTLPARCKNYIKYLCRGRKHKVSTGEGEENGY